MRVAVIADTHCGNRSGLTPPGWQYEVGSGDREREGWAAWQRALWKAYADICKDIQPVHLLIANGDLCDGRGRKSGGIEEIDADRRLQTEMAARCLRQMQAKRTIIVSGTPYHSADDGEDWDAMVAERLKRTTAVGTEQYIDIKGVVLHVKHHAPSSVIPHGQFTGPAREAVWTELRALRRGYPRAQIIVRSHVHYGADAGNRWWRVLLTPCLQGETLYPRKLSLRDIDLGLVVIDIARRGSWEIRYEWIDIPQAQPRVLEL
jgi:hypothetical protein